MANNDIKVTPAPVIVEPQEEIVRVKTEPSVHVSITNIGPQGPAGPSQVLAYHYVQGFASDTWTITHNLGWNPNVTVVDSAGTNCEGEVQYISENELCVVFTGAFSGDAYLS